MVARPLLVRRKQADYSYLKWTLNSFFFIYERKVRHSTRLSGEKHSTLYRICNMRYDEDKRVVYACSHFAAREFLSFLVSFTYLHERRGVLLYACSS